MKEGKALQKVTLEILHVVFYLVSVERCVKYCHWPKHPISVTIKYTPT